MLTLLCLMSIISSANILAMPGPGAPDTIYKLFHEEFPTIENPVFFQEGDTYIVAFKTGENSSERVIYNLDAEMIETIKYYTKDKLEPFIFEKVHRKYKGKTIIGVTEVETSSDHFYQIILQGDKTWWTIIYNAGGFMRIEKRWKGNADNTEQN